MFSIFNLTFAQSGSIDRFDLIGDIRAQMKPGDEARIILSAQASGTGQLKLEIEAPDTLFVSGFDSKSLNCRIICVLTDTLFLKPTLRDFGEHAFNVCARFFTDGVLIDEVSRRIRIEVIPKMDPEPPFTPGTLNQLCWNPFDAGLDYELFTVPRFLGSSKLSEPTFMQDSCKTIQNLPEGVRVGYYVEQRRLDGSRAVFSNVAYSIQDNSPPPATFVQDFSVSSDGHVSIRWPFFQDDISYVDRYVISRREVEPVPGSFAVIDTISFFPARDFTPLNYYPVKAEPGQSLYVDTEDTLFVPDLNPVVLTRLPQELQGAAMIKTGIRDRWQEAEDFLSFNLQTPSYLYVAYDGRINPKASWLEANFTSTRERLITNQASPDEGRLVVYKSNTIFPAGPVHLGGNFARGAYISTSSDLMYVVFVKPVDPVVPSSATGLISYSDFPGQENDLKKFQYKVTTLDVVGHAAEGQPSATVIMDLKGHCRPIVNKWFKFENEVGVQFAQGVSNPICIIDPTTLAQCVGFRDTDSLRFQAAREFPEFFDEHNAGDENVRFFDSDWISVNDLAEPFCYEFNLQPTGKDRNFVNGQRYFYRVRAKDMAGNLSVWSDTVSAIQDVFPPDDISNLRAELDIFSSGENGCVNLSWSPATDPVSGLAAYLIFRSKVGESTFARVASISGDQTTFCDSLSQIPANGLYKYKIGSMDGVGNIRSYEDSGWEVAIQAPVGPQIYPDSSEIVICPPDVVGTTRDSLTVRWHDFDRTDVAGFEIEVISPAASVFSKTVSDPFADQAKCPLQGGDGIYKIRARTVFTDGKKTIYSNQLRILKKTQIAPVENLQAIQDPDGSGDIFLSWTYPAGDRIEQFQLFSWKEGQSQPPEPTVVLPSDSLSWMQSFVQDSLLAYQCNLYAVKAVDCFGLISDPGNIAGQYANPPPVFGSTEITGNDIKICWQRPSPRLPNTEDFDTIVEIHQDSVTGAPFKTVSVFKDTCFTLVNAPVMHNYIFRLQEVVLSDLNQTCADTFRSSPSKRLVVPLDNRPRPVPFEVQALPVVPDSTTGRIFVSWQGYVNAAVDTFLLHLEDLQTPSFSDSFRITESDTLLIKGLNISDTYAIAVLAVDTLGQRSRVIDRKVTAFQPRWLFTPNPENFNPPCFKDSVIFMWNWIDQNLAAVDSTFGADSIMIELSLDPDFEFKTSATGWLPLSGSHLFRRDQDYPFINEQNNALFARIRARDKWNHISPWSSEFAELGSVSGNYDNVPPEQVACTIDSTRASFFAGPDTIDVFLSWPQAQDNCSGAWYYEILRNDRLIGLDSSQVDVHLFNDRRLDMSDALQAKWSIHAVDSVGNRQAMAAACSIDVMIQLPDSSWCVRPKTICWNPAEVTPVGTPLSYFIEITDNPDFFGNPFATERGGPLDTLCFAFQQNWQPVIYWRIKARAGSQLESAWSQTFSCSADSAGGRDVVSSVATQIIPEEFALRQNYPNPFNPSTQIVYDIPESEIAATHIVIEIFNITGQKIRTLVNAEKLPGRYTVMWDGRDDFGMPSGSGLYVYRMRTSRYVAAHKMILLK